MVKQRIDYIDTAKGLLILSAVVGHVFTSGIVHDFIYTFHMPAFFIISGMLFNYSRSLKSTLRHFLWSRIFGIIFPLLFIEAVGMIQDVLNYGFRQNIIGYTYNLLHLRFNNGGNWFLFCLFMAEILFYFTNRVVSKKITYGIAGVMSFVIGTVLPADQYYPELFGEALIAYSFLVIGYLFFSAFLRESKGSLVFCILITAALSVMNGPIELSAKTIHHPLLFLAGSVCGTYVTVQLGKLIKLDWFSYLGQNTLAIYGTHGLMILLLERVIPRTNYALSGLLIFLIILLLEMPIIRFMNNYAPFLVGKKRS